MAVALAHLEAALRARNLDRTLTSSRLHEPRDESSLLPIGLPSLDAYLRGGLPRGQVSEIVGPLTSGRTTLVLKALAAATRRGELVALIDALDRLDVSSAAAAGIDLERVLWIRGAVASHPGPSRDANQRALEQQRIENKPRLSAEVLRGMERMSMIGCLRKHRGGSARLKLKTKAV